MTSTGNPPTGANATLTASGIARLAGVSRAAVGNWRRRYADFPAPAGGPLGSPTFSAREVEEWLHRHGRLKRIGAEQWAWRHIESYQPAARIGDALGIAGAYLLARSAYPASGPGPLTPRQVIDQLRTIDHDLATTVSRGLPESWDPQMATVLTNVDQVNERDPESAFEYLHGQYVTSAQSMSGLASTPRAVADIMLTIAGHGARTFDFTCGTGSILRLAAERALQARVPIQCLAQEINPRYALIALLRMWFVHLRARRAGLTQQPPETHVAGSLLADAYRDLRADVVVANFPFGIHDWGHEQLVYDPRWVYGMPPRTEPELAWVQHALAHLAPGGTAVVLMPPAAAVRPAGRRIRAELIRRGALRAVVALPTGLMPPAGIGLHVWALVQPDDRQPATDRLLFIDAAATDQPLTELIAAAWHAYRDGRHTDLPGVHRTVPAIDILGEYVDLTPQRYLTPADSKGTDPARAVSAIADFERALDDLRQRLRAIQPAPRTGSTTPPASLADLIRTGRMALLRAPGRAGATNPADAADLAGAAAGAAAAAARHTELTVADVLAGKPPTGATGRVTGDDPTRIRPGDVLIAVVGRDIIAKVATTEQVGAAAGPGMYILRIDPDRFDPWFVAGILTNTTDTPGGRRTSGGSGAALRADLKRLTIPVLTPDEQQQYGRAFRELSHLRTALEHAMTTGITLTHDLSAGLAGGTLTVHSVTCPGEPELP